MRLVRTFIQIVFWFQAFAAPFIVFGLVALLFYSKGEKYEGIAVALVVMGILGGIILAEYIRRKIGLDTFFARIYGANEMDERLAKKKKE